MTQAENLKPLEVKARFDMSAEFFRMSLSRIAFLMLGASRASFNIPSITLAKMDRFTIFVMTGRMTSKQSLRIVVGMGPNRQDFEVDNIIIFLMNNEIQE